MTVEERLARLETRVDGTDAWLGKIDEKVDRLLTAAAMGKGAWWAILRVGGLIVLALGAVGWILDHVLRK